MSEQVQAHGLVYEYRRKREHLVIGLMSGTSLDGVDAALVRICTGKNGAVEAVELCARYYLPYSSEMRATVERLCSPHTARIDDLVYTHFGLGRWYAATVTGLIEQAGVSAKEVDVVSMHGQTVWHAPLPRSFPGPYGPVEVTGTLQLGAAAVVKQLTGVPVIADLRAADMAAGGEGAPLAPYIDQLLFGSPDEGRIVQNIGGIGNATVLPVAGSDGAVVAFDTGPGNMIIDALVELASDGRNTYDAEGGIAAQGTVSETLLHELMEDEYLRRPPPKSTGREVYGREFAAGLSRRAGAAGLSFEDMVATATAFTAHSIAEAYRDFVLPHYEVTRVLVGGGGARNPTLLQMLQERVPGGLHVCTTASVGVPDEAREAMAFALIGHESLMGRPGNLPAVTGASEAVVLGTLTL